MNMSNKLRLFSIVCMFIATTALHAQGSGWTVNPHDYQYDMTAYLQLSIDNVMVKNYSNYELGAFVEDECRGVAEVDTKDGYTWLYLRIRSNVATGEEIALRVYDKTSGQTVEARKSIHFVSQSVVGQPSVPMTIYFGAITLGDVNNDGDINIADVTATLSIMAGTDNRKFVTEAADVNGDGSVNTDDVTKILTIIAGK